MPDHEGLGELQQGEPELVWKQNVCLLSSLWCSQHLAQPLTHSKYSKTRIERRNDGCLTDDRTPLETINQNEHDQIYS